MSAPATTSMPEHRERLAGPPVGLRASLVAALALLVASGDDAEGVSRAVLGPAPAGGTAGRTPGEAEPFVRVIVATVSRPPADAHSAALLARACQEALCELWAGSATVADSVEIVAALAAVYRRAVRLLSDRTGASLDEVHDLCLALAEWATSPG